MSKDKLPIDILSEVAHNRPTESPQTHHNNTTNDPQQTHNTGPLIKRHIRISDNDWQRLQAHFQGKGLNMSAGLRMAIREYMSREGI